MKNNRKGFTLLEMLVVVAIIAVLVAIGVPAITNQMEKAREATDLANIRTAITELTVQMAEGVEVEGGKLTSEDPVVLRQTVAGWQTKDVNIAGVSGLDTVSGSEGGSSPKDQEVYVTVTVNDGTFEVSVGSEKE